MCIQGQRVGILVVTYNAASTLEVVLRRIPERTRRQVDRILVFDDASADGTHLLADAFRQENGWDNMTVVRHPQNLGYGGNQKAGYADAIRQGLDIIVLLHGDGQYAPEELPRMIEPLLSKEADAVFGSRMLVPGAARAGGMPLYKRLGNRILTGLQNRLAGARLSEWHSGYRAYRTSLLEQIPFAGNSDDFDFDSEIIHQILDVGGRIREIPIPVFYGDEVCYVNGLRYARQIATTALRHRLAARGVGRDSRFPQAGKAERRELRSLAPARER